MKYDHRVGRLMFTLGVWFTLTGAAWPLNPLVTRNPHPSGPVPAECEEGLAPAPMPRVVVAEIPPRAEIAPAAVPAAPPSRTLRNTLEEAHGALVRNDRPAFNAALASARLIVRDYPPGGERAAAEEAVRVYEDAALLWDAQFESPFFSENTDAYARASRYPGYGEAVRRGILTDDADRRFYPAAESRDFLTRIAAERLNRLGIRATTRVTRAERPRSVPSVSAPPGRSATPSSTTASAAPRRATRRTPGRRAASTPTPSRKSATPAMSAPASPDPPAPARAVAASAPAASPAAAPTPAAPAPSPVAEGQPTEDVPEAAPTPVETDTSLTLPATPAPATSATAAPATPAPERRSILVPALLIAIGLGVLIVLFRVSK